MTTKAIATVTVNVTVIAIEHTYIRTYHHHHNHHCNHDDYIVYIDVGDSNNVDNHTQYKNFML